jgi:hypothetical protein
MRHFATESGKSKGQFYTPAGVSRIMSNGFHPEEDEFKRFAFGIPLQIVQRLRRGRNRALQMDVHL